MRISTTNLVAAFLSATLLAACGGGDSSSTSAPLSVAPQLVTHEPGGTHSAFRRATAGTNLYVTSDAGASGTGSDSVTVYAPDSKKRLQTITQGLSEPVPLVFDGSGTFTLETCTVREP